MRQYTRELSTVDTQRAVEERDKLEDWLRKNSKKAGRVAKGDLVGVTDAWLQAQHYKGNPRSFPGARRQVADRVRKNCNHWLNKMAASENSVSRDIAEHLRKHVKVGMVCEYRGDWKWKF